MHTSLNYFAQPLLSKPETFSYSCIEEKTVSLKQMFCFFYRDSVDGVSVVKLWVWQQSQIVWTKATQPACGLGMLCFSDVCFVGGHCKTIF